MGLYQAHRAQIAIWLPSSTTRLVGSLKNAIADAELFIIQPNRCSRTAWGPAQEGQTEYLRVAMRALRRKLERDPSSPAMPIDELGVGYRLRAGRD